MGFTILIPQSQQVVYASRAGVKFDGSDQSAKLQAILNRGQSGPLKLVIDAGFCKAKGLLCYAGTTVEGLGWDTGVIAATATSYLDACIFRNANFRSSYNGVPIVDHDITIRNMYLDGNSRNGSSGGSSRNYSPDGAPASPIKIFGCNRLLLENLYIYDPCAYAVNLANVFGPGVYGENLVVVDPVVQSGTNPGSGVRNTTMIQVEGPASDLHFNSLSGWCDDDFMALNSCDAQMRNTGFFDFFGSRTAVWYGSINNVTITNCDIQACQDVIRLLSGTPASLPQAGITNVLVSNVNAQKLVLPFLAQDFTDSNGSTGQGLLNNIVFDKWNLATPFGTADAAYVSSATVNNFTMSGWKVYGVPNCSRGLVSIGPTNATTLNTTIGQLKFADWTIYEGASELAAQPMITVPSTYVTISDLVLDGVAWSRNAATAAAMLDMSAGTVTRTRLIGVSADNIDNVVKIHGTSVSTVDSVGLHHRGATSGQASINVASGTLPALRASGSDTALLAAGTITSNKNDSTQDS